MGRKPRVSKADLIRWRLYSLDALPDNPLPENFISTSAPNSLPEVQTITTEGTCLSDTSRVVKKKLRTPTAVIRRSPRTQSTSGNQSKEPVIDPMIVIGSQNNTTGPVVHEGIEDKEASDESRSSKKDDIGTEDIKYQAMYQSAQKKIEALSEENMQLSKALELAKGKIQVYEKQSNAYSEVMAVIQSLSKVNEHLATHLAARVYPGAPSDDNEMFEERSAKKKKKNVTFDLTNKL